MVGPIATRDGRPAGTVSSVVCFGGAGAGGAGAGGAGAGGAGAGGAGDGGAGDGGAGDLYHV